MIKRESTTSRQTTGPRTLAVIDIGASSIRMEVAEVDEAGTLRNLERLIQGVSVGKDTFALRQVSKQTIEDCVRVLRSYRAKLQEYRVFHEDDIRVVATSAVREATNRLSFLDRIYSATGFRVETIDEAEISRVTYLGVLPLIQAESSMTDGQTVIVEVGGGSTDVLLLDGTDVVHSQTYRLGSLRLQETLETFHASRANSRHIMENQIDRTIEQLREYVNTDGPVRLLALGGDIRFASAQINRHASSPGMRRIGINELERFTDEMLGLKIEQIIQRYHLTLPDAETLGPALLTYVRLAREFQLPDVVVTDFNLRNALLREMSLREGWRMDFRKQSFRSALELARRFDVDEPHARHVAHLAHQLFVQLHDEHGLDARWEIILGVAALLHEVGLFISNKSYHKHSMYIISNSEIFGLGSSDLQLVAQVARYHRRASPKSSHTGFGSLDRDDRIAVAQLAALLRIAVSLDHSRSQRIHELRVQTCTDRLIVEVPGIQDLSLEQLELKQKSNLFEEVFGQRVMLRGIK